MEKELFKGDFLKFLLLAVLLAAGQVVFSQTNTGKTPGGSSSAGADVRQPKPVITGAEQMDAWLPLSFAINALNRSMGQQDAYPFVLSPGVIDKLRFIHRIVHHAPAG